jgi:hypothetical protein
MWFKSNKSKSKKNLPKLRRNIKKVLNPYLKDVKDLKKTIPDWNNFFQISEEDRINQWVRLRILGQPLVEKYAWAIPDQRALNIIEEFQPIVELGCGNGYWSSLLKKMNVDIVSIDKFVDESKCYTNVIKGGPKLMKTKSNQNRNLFLCYPDEAELLSLKCLEYFDGEYIIHVGELMQFSGTISSAQAPWGRTTSSSFQVALHEEFHCLLNAKLPSFPFSKDCISVWKRTNWVAGLEDDDDDDDEMDSNDDSNDNSDDNSEDYDGDETLNSNDIYDDNNNEEYDNNNEEYDENDCNSDEKENDNLWANIPFNERLPCDIAAPCLLYLLKR